MQSSESGFSSAASAYVSDAPPATGVRERLQP
jgi:hypothetical protein